MQLRDKTVIVTGASSGIGASAALLFAAQGANMILSARREPLLRDLVERISDQGGRAIAVAGDVTDQEYNSLLVERAVDEFGKLDAAFNNAGIMGEIAPVPDMPADTWHDVIATNLTSAFFAAKYQIPAMKDAGGGSIVFTSSFVGNTNAGLPGMAAYAASKSGLVGFTKSIAAQHGADGVRANALLPGGTLTDMAGDDSSVHDLIAGLHPLKRMAKTEEIAQAALFLLSDQSSFVTGSAMIADGGISVRFG